MRFFAGRRAGPGSTDGSTADVTMKRNMGMLKKTLWREAQAARAPRAAAVGSALPPAATAADEAMSTFCAGQITIHTL